MLHDLPGLHLGEACAAVVGNTVATFRHRRIRSYHHVRPHIQSLPGTLRPPCPSWYNLTHTSTQHDALLRSAEMALRKGVDSEPHKPCVLVFFSHHRPHLAHRDMEFFLKAAEQGWICNEIVTERFPVRLPFRTYSTPLLICICQPMFPDDPGDEEVRATVHGWRLTRKPESLRLFSASS